MPDLAPASQQQPRDHPEYRPARRMGGTGPRSNGNSFGPSGHQHRWPCHCQWCLEGTVPEQAG